MKLHLTEAQLLQEWQLRYLPPMVNTGCIAASHSGYDMEAIIMARMRDWYARLLMSGDTGLLAPVDIGDRLAMTVADDGTGTVILPDNVIKVLSVDMKGWKSPAVITRDPSSRIAQRRRSPYSRATDESPVAIIDGRKMAVYTPPEGVTDISVSAIVDDPDTFHIDSAALSTIKSFYSEILP